MLTTDTVMILLAAMFPQLWPLVIVAFLLRHSGLLWRVIYTTGGLLGASRAELEGGLVWEAIVWALPAAGDELETLPETPSPRLFIPFLTLVPSPTTLPALPAPAPMAVDRHDTDQGLAPQGEGEQAGQETRSSTHTEAGPVVASTAQRRPQVALLKLISQAPHWAVVGPTGAGKSTMLQNLAYRYAKAGARVVVLDPHAEPDSWPQGCEVVGAGRDYMSIGAFLAEAVGEMQQRYDLLANGARKRGAFKRWVIIADEWRSIARKVEGGGPALAELITEARKAGITLGLGAHSPYLGSLFGGAKEGDSAIRESLTLIRLCAAEGERWAEVDGERYNVPVPLAEELLTGAVFLGPSDQSETAVSDTAPIPPDTGTHAETEPSVAFTRDPDFVPVLARIGAPGTLAPSTPLPSTLPPPLPDDEEAVGIRAMLDAGLSKNKIAGILGGSKTTAYNRINRAVGLGIVEAA